MEKTIINVDLNKTSDIYSTIFTLMKRKNSKDNILQISNDGIATIILEDEFFILRITVPELNKKYASSSWIKLEKSTSLNDFNKFYSYLGQVMSLFVLFNTIDNGCFHYKFISKEGESEFFKIKNDIKITLKLLATTTHMIDSNNLFVDLMMTDKDDSEKHSFNSIVLTKNFEEFIDEICDDNNKSTFIPHSRLMNLCYLSLYYFLIGVLDKFSNSINMDLGTFIMGLNEGKSIGLQYLDKLYVKNNTSLYEDTKIFAFLHLFYKMSVVQYIFNDSTSLNVLSNSIKTKTSEIDKNNTLVVALVELGKHVEQFFKESSELKHINIHKYFGGEKLNQDNDQGTIFDSYNFLRIIGLEYERDDPFAHLASVLIGYEMSLFVYDVRIKGLTFCMKRNMFNNLFTIIFDPKSIFYKHDLFETDGVLMAVLDPNNLLQDALRHIEENLEDVDANIFSQTDGKNPYDYLKSKIFLAAYARFSYHNSEIVKNRLKLELSIEEIQNISSNIVVLLDSHIHNLYSHWFCRENLLYNHNAKLHRYDVYGNLDVQLQHKSELDILLLKYIKYSTCMFNKDDKLSSELALFSDAISENCRDLFVKNICKYSKRSFIKDTNVSTKPFNVDLSSNYRYLANKTNEFEMINKIKGTKLISLFIKDQKGCVRSEYHLSIIKDKGINYVNILPKIKNLNTNTISAKFPDILSKTLGNYTNILIDNTLSHEEKFFLLYIIPATYLFRKTDEVIGKKIINNEIFSLKNREDSYKSTMESFIQSMERNMNFTIDILNKKDNVWKL